MQNEVDPKVLKLARTFHALVDLSLDKGVDEELAYQKFEGYMNGFELGLCVAVGHPEWSQLMLNTMADRRNDAVDMPKVATEIVRFILEDDD